MSSLKRRKRTPAADKWLILDSRNNVDFSFEQDATQVSTPNGSVTRKNENFGVDLQTIIYKPEVHKVNLRDDESDSSEDPSPFDVDTVYVEDSPNVEESEHLDTNNHNNFLDDAKVEYFRVGDVLIITIPGHSTTCFEGLTSLKVLFGEVEVLGYTLNRQSGSNELYSPRGCSLLYIKNTGNRISQPHKDIFDGLSVTGSSKEITNIFKRIKPTDAVVLCQEIKSFQVDFLVNHISQQIYPSSQFLSCSFGQNQKDGNSIRINPEWDQIIDGVTNYSRILLAGGKSVGKSTFLRYMINKLLIKHKEVLVIDLDPGQPEFTVPGCISASIVTKPLFGPNFTHLRKPNKCIFVPDIDLSEDVEEYIDFVKFLLTQCSSIPLMPTIINNMGFTRGLGFYILSAVVVYVQPTTIVNIKSKKNARNYRVYVSADNLFESANMFKRRKPNSLIKPKIITINSMSDTIYRWHLEPRLIREMCILNYFGTMVTTKGMALTDIETCTYRINTSAVNILDNEGPISFSAINGNLVALCSSIRGSKCYNCIGWGIVRAINFDSQDLYVLTPVSQDDLEQVNTFILGSVTLPPSVLMNTSNVSGMIPYVASGILKNLGELTKRSHVPRSSKRSAVDD